MSKLTFRYGTVSSAKTLNLLAVAHNYERQGKRVVVIKPRVDQRYGEREVTSRAGLTREAHLIVDADTILDRDVIGDAACVLVDEAQFLSEALVDQLRALTLDPGVPVIAFGLRTDFRTQLFPGSRRLLEVADSVEEVKTTCHACGRKALFNLKLVNGVPVREGASIELGGDELYRAVCWAHYAEAHGAS